jgi:hypothetical protein
MRSILHLVQRDELSPQITKEVSTWHNVTDPLLFPYFEVWTIERATACFYSVITEYIILELNQVSLAHLKPENRILSCGLK